MAGAWSYLATWLVVFETQTGRFTMSKYTTEEPTITLELTVEEAAVVAGLAYTADLDTIRRGLHASRLRSYARAAAVYTEAYKRVQDVVPAARAWRKAYDALQRIEALPAHTPAPYFTVEATYRGHRSVEHKDEPRPARFVRRGS